MTSQIAVILPSDGSRARLWRDPALSPGVNRRRNSRFLDEQFALEYLVDFQCGAAAARCGITRNPDAAGRALARRPRVQALIQAETESRRIRLQIDADFVLQALMQQYVRLSGMLGQDISALYSDSGSIKPLVEWPTVWRTRLVTEIHSQDTFEYSKDGTQAGESKTWDKSGVITKIKRESTLAIEKEMRECLKVIGQHINVKAFPTQEKSAELHLHIHAEVTAKLQAALIREAKLIEVKNHE